MGLTWTEENFKQNVDDATLISVKQTIPHV